MEKTTFAPISPATPLAAALRAAAIACALAAALPTPVLAQPAPSAARIRFDIPAGPLDAALHRFGRQTGVLLSVDAGLTAGLTSPGVQGEETVDGALTRLLTGTGLAAQRAGDGSYSLRRAAEGAEVTLKAVRVAGAGIADGAAALGYRSETVSQVGPWQGRKLDDLPYSMTVLPAELIENVRGANTDQLFRINPTTHISRSQNENNQPSVFMRGFRNQGFYRDGLSATNLQHDISLEDTERVEILSGLSGFLYGPGNVGGIVNFITKRPTAERLNRLNVRNNGGENFHVHGDFGGPIDRDGRFGYRINAAWQDGETAVEHMTLRKNFVSAAFDWNIADDLLWQVNLVDQDYYTDGNQAYWGLAAGATRPSARSIDNTRTSGQPWTKNHYANTIYGTNLRWQATPWLTVRGAWQEVDGKRAYNYTNNTLQADGTYTQNVFEVNPPSWGKHYYEMRENRGQLFADLRFDTGGISHQLTVGTQYYHYDHAGYTKSAPAQNTLIGVRPENGPVYVDKPVAALADPGVFQSNRFWEGGMETLSLGDDIQITEQWSLLAGLSRATIESPELTGRYARAGYEKSDTTPSLSLIYKPLPEVTTYVTYMESLEQGGIAGQQFNGQPVINAGEVMEPLISTQYEIGAKWAVGDVLLSTALFQIDKSLQYYNLSNPAAPVYVQDGRQVHRGIEFTTFGRVAERWSLVGGLTLLDAEVTKQQQNTALEGKRPPQVAEQLFKLRAEYDTPWLPGLTLVAGAHYTSDQYIDAMNTDRLPSYTLFDAGVRYATSMAGYPLTLRFEAQNLGDKHYWINGSSVGDPRTLTFSVSLDI